MKRRIVHVLPNDDDRVVRLHVDDLHPSSRLRRSLEHDILDMEPARQDGHADVINVNTSRDTLLSLVASQRHNLILVKGDTTPEELEAELQRDCVDIVPKMSPSAEHALVSEDIRALCDHIADAIAHWPRLRESMKLTTCASEWSTSTTAAVIQLAFKPSRQTSLGDRTLRDPCYHLLNAMTNEGIDLHSLSHSDLLKSFSLHLEKVSQRGPFWSSYTDESKEILSPRLRDLAENLFLQESSSIRLPIREVMRNFHARAPNIGKLFATFSSDSFTPVRQCLGAALEARGFRIQRWMQSTDVEDGILPITFPTMWHVKSSDFYRKRPYPTFVMERVFE